MPEKAVLEVRSQHSGTVVDIHSNGSINRHDEFIVVEQMKMQMTQEAPMAGVLTMLVNIGEYINEDDLIATIKEGE
jgi:biotin carboxyl carrier protein